MKIQDLINKLTEIADQTGEVEIEGETELDENPVMIPPLQANLEMLKRATDLPNVYDDEEECDDEEGTMSFEFDDTPEDHELADIQRLAGIQSQPPEVPMAAIITLATNQSFPG